MKPKIIALFAVLALTSIVLSSCDLLDEYKSTREDSKRARNVKKAIENLALMATIQFKYKDKPFSDSDSNGTGEFGNNYELSKSGLAEKRGFKYDPDSGFFRKNGYYFWVVTDGTEFRRERYYCVYSWPEELWVTGDTAFFMEQDGKIYTNANDGYAGIQLSGMKAPVSKPMAYRENRIFGEVNLSIWRPYNPGGDEVISQ